MRTALFLVLALTGCDFVKTPPKVDIPPIPVLDGLKLPLPKTPDGKYLLMELSQAHLEVDPTVRDAITVVGNCTDLVTYCYKPDSALTLDVCVAGAKTCTTEQPWTEAVGCCPKKCQEDFATERLKGTGGAEALDLVFFERKDCWPGLANALEGK